MPQDELKEQREDRKWLSLCKMRCVGGALHGTMVSFTGDDYAVVSGDKLQVYKRKNNYYLFDREQVMDEYSQWPLKWVQENYDPLSTYHWFPFDRFKPAACGIHPSDVNGSGGSAEIPAYGVICEDCRWCYETSRQPVPEQGENR